MKTRTFISMLLGFTLFFILSGIFYANRLAMAERFIVWPDRTIPLYAALGLTFLLGLAVALSISLARESRHALERWRENRMRREAQTMDEMYARGVEAMLEGQPGSALEQLRAVVARQPRRVDALLKAGEILRGLGRHDEARELHLRAHRAAPADPAPLHELVADADAAGDLSAARTHLLHLVQLKPRGAVGAYRRLRDVYIRENDWDKAIEVHERILKIRPRNSIDEETDDRAHLGITYEIGLRLQRTGRHREALAQMRKLLKESATFVPAWRALGEVRLLMGDAENAVTTWLEGYERTSSPALLTRLEDHFLHLERPERAIEVFRRAVASASPDTVPRFYLGKLYYRLEMLDEAMHEFSALQNRAAYTPTLCYYLAKIHERRQRYAEANSEYRRIIREGQLLSAQFHCLMCGKEYDTWIERCKRCHEWNSVEVEFKEDVSLEELGISSAPVYTAPRS